MTRVKLFRALLEQKIGNTNCLCLPEVRLTWIGVVCDKLAVMSDTQLLCGQDGSLMQQLQHDTEGAEQTTAKR
jgi:hypothetical protein